MTGQGRIILGAFVWAAFAASGWAVTPDAGDPSLHQHHEHHRPPAGSSRTVGDYTIPAIPVTTSDGRQLAASELLRTDKPVLVNFIFTSCTSVCPVMSATFRQLREKLGPARGDVEFVSISIDPEQDTPARLREYARKFQADAHWHFVTGTEDDIVALQRAFGAFRGNKNNHAPVTFVRATPGSRWVRIDGLVGPEALRREVYPKDGT